MRIGTLATAEEAIEVAIRDYGITEPERQRRLIHAARRTADGLATPIAAP